MAVAFEEVVQKIADATSRVEADEGASPVLVAVVREFQAKLAKAERRATDRVPDHDSVVELEQAGDSAKAAAEADPGLSNETRDSVLELEQAGDSAKAAAEADAGLSSDTRESVLAAHLSICMLKAGA